MEILAPAGNLDAVIAAVQNGADAVYLGGKGYNARQHADNFDEETFATAVAYCHLRGVKVYQTVNTLVYDDELAGLQEVLALACKVGVDALIIQDLGVLARVKACCPTMKLHGSTQMTVHTAAGARFCLAQGLSRVVLARELSVAEIVAIAKAVPIELEVFGHGALCMSVSGQCYLSAMIGTRSGNRGSCAGSCRLPFGCERPEDCDLSLKDLSAAAVFESLQTAGVTALKIEGRMKRPEYVAAAAAAYVALRDGKMPELQALEAVFSRNGFTDGYLTGKRDGDMFGMRGKGDVLAATEQVLGGLRQTYHKERARIGVTLDFVLTEQGAWLKVQDGDGHAVEVQGAGAERAVNRPTTVEMAREALEKLGGTPYFAAGFAAAVDEGLILPKSTLNELRRQAIAALDEARLVRPSIPFKVVAAGREISPRRPETVARFAQLVQVDWDLWERVVLPLWVVWEQQETLAPYASRIVLEVERVLFGREGEVQEQLKMLHLAGYTTLAASNPAHLQLGKELGYRLFGMPFLNCTNSEAAEALAAYGVEELVLSFEMTASKLARVQSTAALGAVVYGSLPLMVVRNCPLKRHGGCRDCRGARTLRDRLGNDFAVRCVERHYAELFNCKCLWLADRLNEFAGLHLYYFTAESRAEIAAIQSAYQTKEAPTGAFTRGLYYRKIT